MTTSQITENSKRGIVKNLSRGDLAYVCARNQHQAHNLLLRAIKECNHTQKDLSVMTGIDEGVISRLLRRPSNVEINTLSKLLYAACGSFIHFSKSYPSSNAAHGDSSASFYKVRMDKRNEDTSSTQPQPISSAAEEGKRGGTMRTTARGFLERKYA